MDAVWCKTCKLEITYILAMYCFFLHILYNEYAEKCIIFTNYCCSSIFIIEYKEAEGKKIPRCMLDASV